MRITNITTQCQQVTLPPRGRISLNESGTAAPPTLIDLIMATIEADGQTGLGFTAIAGPGAKAVRSLIDVELAPLLIGEDPRDTDRLFAKASTSLRSVGFAGLAARAYCALDLACWDLKAKAAGAPLYQLLGHHKASASFFISDLAVTGREASEAIRLAKPLLKQGATGLRVAVGFGDVQADADRVRDIQEGLGDQGWVSVAASERYDLGSAQALSHFFEDIGVDLFEDPIPTTDEAGYARMAALKALPLAVGSSFDSVEDFYRVIRNGAVRTVRPDVCRLGGLTPLLKVATVAEAFHVGVSPVRMPEVGVHLACGLSSIASVDYVSWFSEVLQGPRMEGGKILPPSEPGLGIQIKNA